MAISPNETNPNVTTDDGVRVADNGTMDSVVKHLGDAKDTAANVGGKVVDAAKNGLDSVANAGDATGNWLSEHTKGITDGLDGWGAAGMAIMGFLMYYIGDLFGGGGLTGMIAGGLLAGYGVLGMGKNFGQGWLKDTLGGLFSSKDGQQASLEPQMQPNVAQQPAKTAGLDDKTKTQAMNAVSPSIAMNTDYVPPVPAKANVSEHYLS